MHAGSRLQDDAGQYTYCIYSTDGNHGRACTHLKLLITGLGYPRGPRYLLRGRPRPAWSEKVTRFSQQRPVIEISHLTFLVPSLSERRCKLVRATVHSHRGTAVQPSFLQPERHCAPIDCSISRIASSQFLLPQMPAVRCTVWIPAVAEPT